MHAGTHQRVRPCCRGELRELAGLRYEGTKGRLARHMALQSLPLAIYSIRAEHLPWLNMKKNSQNTLRQREGSMDEPKESIHLAEEKRLYRKKPV